MQASHPRRARWDRQDPFGDEEQYGQAEEYLLEALSILKGRGDRALIERTHHCLVGLGNAAPGLKKYRASIAHFREGLGLALAIKDFAGALDAIVGSAYVLAEVDRTDDALQLLAFALGEPAIGHKARARAALLFASLTEQLSEPVAASAQERGKAFQFDEMAQLLLEWQQHLGS